MAIFGSRRFVYPEDVRPELAMQPVRVTGRVIDRYADRDPDASTLLFQTDAPFDDGMRGGPVYGQLLSERLGSAGRMRPVSVKPGPAYGGVFSP